MRAPLAPSGWPRAIAPPLTFTFSQGAWVSFCQASTTEAKASFTSNRSMSSIVKPAFFNTFSVQGMMPVNMIVGSTPAVAVATIRARGLSPNSSAFSREAISTAEGFDQVGFCLDTCHAWAGGIELGDAVERIRAITGRIDLVHANDSRDDAGSGADRHANFGQGQLPPDEFAAVVREAGAPVVCETPGGAAEHAADFAWLRERL